MKRGGRNEEFSEEQNFPIIFVIDCIYLTFIRYYILGKMNQFIWWFKWSVKSIPKILKFSDPADSVIELLIRAAI